MKQIFYRPFDTEADHVQDTFAKGFLSILLCGMIFLSVEEIMKGNWWPIIMPIVIIPFGLFMYIADRNEKKSLKVLEIHCDDQGIRIFYEEPGPIFYADWEQISRITLYSDNEAIYGKPRAADWGNIYFTGEFIQDNGKHLTTTIRLGKGNYMTERSLYIATFLEDFEGTRDKIEIDYCAIG